MIVLVSKFLVYKGFRGITLWPFVVMCSKELKQDRIFLNHESIHLRQQEELLVLPFYLWYVMEYMVRLFQFKNRHQAYKNISFEREAYANEKDLNYLQKRSFWTFLKYVVD